MYLEFNEDYRTKIRNYFDSLDVLNTGSIGIEELEEPLITLGIAKGRKEVKKIMDEIDEDGSGEIEFNEFLMILKGKTTIYGDQKQEESNSAITEFFKSMINGDIKEVHDDDPSNQSSSFKLILGQMRRHKLLDKIENKEFNHDLVVPYKKLIHQIKPGERVNTAYEAQYSTNSFKHG